VGQQVDDEDIRHTGSSSSLKTLRIIDWAYEQRVPPGAPYFGLLDRIHQHLVPRTYVEVGVSTGRSITLALPGTVTIGIDPCPEVKFPLRRRSRIFRQTSDEFFSQHDLFRLFGGTPVDLAFIDGMHHFEYALRDFMNLERFSDPASTILIHDCLPIDETTADRERSTNVWSGDIWRLILLLRSWRPDLRVSVVDTGPTGLGLVRGLDPASTVLRDHYDDIVAQYLSLPYCSADGEDPRNRLSPVPGDWETVRSLLPDQPFRPTNIELLKGLRSSCGIRPLAGRAVRRVRRNF
jgi:hypothetical protein